MEDYWKQTPKKLFGSSTALIAGITALSYLYALMFEIGYLNYFGLNYQSAHVVTESFIIFGSISLLVALLLIGYGEVLVNIWKPWTLPDHPFVEWFLRSVRLALIIFILGSAWIFYYTSFHQAAIAIIFLTILILVIIIRLTQALNKWIGRSTFIRKVLSLDIPISAEYHAKTRVPMSSIILILAGVGFSLSIGKFFAKSETTFKQVDENKIIIREYGEDLIIAEIENNQKLTGLYDYVPKTDKLEFKILKLDKLSK